MKKTFSEIINANGGNEVQFKVAIEDNKWIAASCWTDDPDTMNEEAFFDVSVSWGQDGVIGRYDNINGELDIFLDKLNKLICENVGGKWCYSGADCGFVQVG